MIQRPLSFERPRVCCIAVWVALLLLVAGDCGAVGLGVAGDGLWAGKGVVLGGKGLGMKENGGAGFGVRVKGGTGFGVRVKGGTGLVVRGKGLSGMVIETNVRGATCGNANGWMQVEVTGGSAPYQYAISAPGYAGSGVYQAVDTFSNLPGGSYTVTVKDNMGQVGSTSTIIGDILGPTITTGATSASCLNNDGTVQITAGGGTTPYQYSIGNGSFGPAATFGSLPSGPVTVTVQDANGCQASTTATVPFHSNLSLQVLPGGTICQGTSTTLASKSNAASYAWTPATGLNDASAAQPSASPAATTTYNVTATLGVCTLTGSATVTVLAAPVATVGPSDTICPGKSATLKGGGGVSYKWSPAAGLSNALVADPVVVDPQQTVTYSLTVTDAAGCASLDPASETVVVTPPPAVFAGNDTSVLIGQPLPLKAVDIDNSGFVSYEWSPVEGLNNAGVADPVVDVTSSMTYTVVATTAGGCKGSGSVKVEAFSTSGIIVPNAFSPNGDGHNDVLHVIAIGIRDFKSFMVFDRWGQRVFSTTNASIGWDGTIGGKVQPLGTYVWVAAGVDYTGMMVEKRGTVMLVR